MNRWQCRPGTAGRRTALALPLLAVPLFALPMLARPASACGRTRIAELPLRLVEHYAIVTAGLAGRAVSLVLDTGAQGMLVTPEAAAALHLPVSGATRIFGTGGSEAAAVVRLPGLQLGGVAMPEQDAPVAALPVSLAVDPPLAGLLGASVLSRFDVEIDVPGRRMTLWSPERCAPPLAGATAALQLSPLAEAYVAVEVNGQGLLALIDTGSRATILSTEAARRLGLSMPVSANTVPGVDGRRLPIGHIQARLALPGDAASLAPISIAPLQLDRGDMLLGLDQLGRRRLWISYAGGVAVFGPMA